MSKQRFQIEEKYLGNVQLENILIFMLSSSIKKSDQIPFVFTLQQKGTNDGLQ